MPLPPIRQLGFVNTIVWSDGANCQPNDYSVFIRKQLFDNSHCGDILDANRLWYRFLFDLDNW